jgi:hypothetical protein
VRTLIKVHGRPEGSRFAGKRANGGRAQALSVEEAGIAWGQAAGTLAKNGVAWVPVPVCPPSSMAAYGQLGGRRGTGTGRADKKRGNSLLDGHR